MILLFDIALLIAFGSVLLYLALLSLLALMARKGTTSQADRLRTFAVVVPAHDEEAAIERTLISLSGIRYPTTLFDAVVVADNCNDRTADVARAAGAIVLERFDAELKGKGYALRWCFDDLLSSDRHYDAVLVVDADSVVSENILSVLNLYLDEGASVLQVNDLPEARPEAWSSEVTRLGMTLYNYVRPLGRRVLGWSAGLRGNGMCFSPEILRSVPWDAFSLTEDLEYGLKLLLKGYPVLFAPEASVLATMPTKIQNAASQRRRWETGRWPVIRRMAPLLLFKAMKTCRFIFIDALFDLVIPPFVNIVAVALLLGLATLSLTALGLISTWLVAAGWMVVLGLAATHVIAGLIAAGADRDLVRALRHVPRYALWKLVLYLKIFISGTEDRWIRTTRE